MRPALANLPTIQRRRETRTLTSSVAVDAEGKPLSLEVTLEGPGPLERGAFQDLVQLYLERYVKGRRGTADQPPLVPSRLSLGPAGSVQLNESVCGTMAALEVLQPKAGPDGAEVPGDARLDVQYLGLLILKAPDVWDELVAWGNDMFANPYAGNSPAPDASSSSGAASPSTPGTPTPCSTEPTSDGALTPASAPSLGGVLNIPVSSAASTPEWGPGSSLPA